MGCRPFIVACIPAFNEERTISGIVVQVLKYVDRVVVCDDGSGDLTGARVHRYRSNVIEGFFFVG